MSADTLLEFRLRPRVQSMLKPVANEFAQRPPRRSAAVMELDEDGEQVLPLRTCELRDVLVWDATVMEETRDLRAGVDVTKCAGNLLERHAGDRPVVVFIRIRERTVDLTPERAVATSEFEADFANLLQPGVGVGFRLGA